MRRFLIFLTFVCVAVSVSPLKAAPIADSLAFQGRVTDASDNPLPDGPRDLTISLWSDSVGGTMLHSEIVVVTLSKGLYSTCIGCGSSSFFDIFAEQSVYLQVQLAGSPPMTPRTPMRSVPFSVSSSSLHGKKQLPGGQVVSAAVSSVSALGGGGGGGAAAASYARLSADEDGDGHDDFVVTDSATTSSATRVMSHDSDDDGDSDGDISFSMTPTTSSVAIKQKGTGADKDRVVIQTTQIGLNPGTSMVMSRDHDDDGLMDRDITSMTDDIGARLAIKTKGTSAQRLSAGTDCDDTEASTYLDCDDDGDGIAESSISSNSGPEGASMSVNGINNNGMPNRISMNVTVGKQTQSATFGERCDMGNDGSDETATTISTDSGGTAMAMDVKLDNTPARLSTNMTIGRQTQKADFGSRCYVDGDDDPESEFSQIVTPTTSSVAIKTKGTGADKNRTISSSCNDTSATQLMTTDDDGDGRADASIKIEIGAAGHKSSIAASSDPDDDGSPEGEFESIVTPGTCSVAIKTKGTGADANRVITSSSPDSVSTEHTFEFTNSLLMPALMKAKEKANRTKCSNNMRYLAGTTDIESEMSCDSGTARSTWSSASSGLSSSSLTVQASLDPLANPIEHSSGAHLTPGGVWTNASDENLKENFQSVDGAELLEKIEQLQISEWNYKNESDETKHIGPTAQDFQKIFGVGSDGKSISTIDPSGIALAAIKELKKENTELKKQIEELSGLKGEIEQLKKLLSEKK
jgi:hypothetical protein